MMIFKRNNEFTEDKIVTEDGRIISFEEWEKEMDYDEEGIDIDYDFTDDEKERLDKEAEEIFSTDDIQERIKIWKKYHPGEEIHLEEGSKN